MATFTDRDAIREGYGKPHRRFSHPGRHAQALATSGAGIVHREMMDLQRQPELNKAETGRLKELRRDWNRNRKYTDAGMSLAGVTTPQGAQDAFMRSTEDFRQLNKPAYNQMYPLTGGFMDYAGKGGLLGMFLSGLAGKTKKNIMDYGKDLLEKKGILGTVDSSPQDQVEYADQTFGPNMYDVAGPWFGTAPIEDVEISDLPSAAPIEDVEISDLPITGVDRVDDITVTDQMPSFFDKWWKPWLGRQKETEVIPGYETTYIDEPVPETYNDWFMAPPEKEGNLISDELWDSIRDFDLDTIGGGGELHAGEDIEVPDWLLDPSLPMPDELTEGEYLPGEYHDELISPPALPAYDDSAREAGIIKNMSPYSRNYVPPLKFPPIGPHDPFDPDQNMFENREEYDAWLRRQRLGY